MTGAWLVIDDDCVDNTRVFAREADAEAHTATCSPGTSVSYQEVIGATTTEEAQESDCPHCGYPVIDGSGAVVRCEMCGAYCCEDHHRRHPSYAHHDIAPNGVQTGEQCAACAHPESLHDERIRTVGDGVAPCTTCAVCVAVHTGQPDDDEPGIDDELDIEEYDHSRAKEDSRNARYRR